VKNKLLNAKKKLRDAGIETFSIDAELIMMETTGFSRVELITKDDYTLNEEQELNFNNMLEKRLKSEPMAYILNRQEFMGLDFYVDENVLIPRTDTEVLVEACLEYISNGDKVLDMCTGSGAIAVSLAYFNRNVEIAAVDISHTALEIAKKNAKQNGVLDRINFIKSGMFAGLEKSVKMDMIVSNPPYIETEEINKLLPNVKDYEPTLALDGGIDGLDFYKILASEGKNFLVENGFVLLEIGYNQKETVTDIFTKEGYEFLECRKDLGQLDRVLIFRRFCSSSLDLYRK